MTAGRGYVMNVGRGYVMTRVGIELLGQLKKSKAYVDIKLRYIFVFIVAGGSFTVYIVEVL